MKYVALFLLVVIVLGVAAALLGSYIGISLTEALFGPESLEVPPQTVTAVGS